MHAMDVVHRDIKPANILLESRKPMIIRVADFGLAKLMVAEESDHVSEIDILSACHAHLSCRPFVVLQPIQLLSFPRVGIASRSTVGVLVSLYIICEGCP